MLTRQRSHHPAVPDEFCSCCKSRNVPFFLPQRDAVVYYRTESLVDGYDHRKVTRFPGLLPYPSDGGGGCHILSNPHQIATRSEGWVIQGVLHQDWGRKAREKSTVLGWCGEADLAETPTGTLEFSLFSPRSSLPPFPVRPLQRRSIGLPDEAGNFGLPAVAARTGLLGFVCRFCWLSRAGPHQAMSGNRPSSQRAHADPLGGPTLTELVLQLREELRRLDQRVGEGLAGIEERVIEFDRTVQGIMGRIVALEGAIREPECEQIVERPQPQRPPSPVVQRPPPPRAALAGDCQGQYANFNRELLDEE
ncbi:hypothetical protein Taro_036685, partial [Colocasia esculenta]|nr:hypothetical protein [Colocasia esculenta]